MRLSEVELKLMRLLSEPLPQSIEEIEPALDKTNKLIAEIQQAAPSNRGDLLVRARELKARIELTGDKLKAEQQVGSRAKRTQRFVDSHSLRLKRLEDAVREARRQVVASTNEKDRTMWQRVLNTTLREYESLSRPMEVS